VRVSARKHAAPLIVRPSPSDMHGECGVGAKAWYINLSLRGVWVLLRDAVASACVGAPDGMKSGRMEVVLGCCGSFRVGNLGKVC
jgi:hypothetical protein